MHFIKFAALGLCSILSVSSTLIRSCTEPNTVALTFDDGPFQYTTELLDYLKEAGIHATFFINGNNYWPELSTDPEKQAILKRVAEEGHQIASHTWNHEIPEQNGVIDKQSVLESLSLIEDLVYKNTGKYPTYFRAPKGEIDEATVMLFEEFNYKVIQWDTDTNDWNRVVNGVKHKDHNARIKAAKEFLTNEYYKKKENYLVLMHDVQPHTVKEIVPYIINNGIFQGYNFVTVAECLGDPTGGWSTIGGNALSILNGGAPPNNNVVQNNYNADVDTIDYSYSNTDFQENRSITTNLNNEVMNLKSDGFMTKTVNFYVIATIILSALYMLL
ncbi:glycoside hydrolase/deacetylase [Piromyces finnis]|uniref:Glycoside hydrolase/deacetylase n=1 Tax=Piromyces finnis TaxID=1754191 RepID=A0A1Y1V914_9FUNG|nr:glycoside hydrolase/deacetylase [Piromyces finnis]ORX49576.1 glycoside hydrolase/deacetylase [Piromyces finnis]|eukprot:ORX42223.1 glycoside hydrolase/deacetylase [Piromyces finnis]